MGSICHSFHALHPRDGNLSTVSVAAAAAAGGGVVVAAAAGVTHYEDESPLNTCPAPFDGFVCRNLYLLCCSLQASLVVQALSSTQSSSVLQYSGGLGETATSVIIVVSAVIVAVKIVIIVKVCRDKARSRGSTVTPDTRFLTLTLDKFLNDMEREKPIRFTEQQLRVATNNFSTLLGSGGFGSVYKAMFTNGTTAAVKVLNGSSDKRIEEQFMAEIVGRRRNLDVNLPESQEWFPKWVWKKFEREQVGDLMIVCSIEEKDREMVEKMAKIALWCVQYNPEERPPMSRVVKMLEGTWEIPKPTNPFRYLFAGNVCCDQHQFTRWTCTSFNSGLSHTAAEPIPHATPIMRKYEIEISSM
ncbi:hypothetical protein RJ641_027827 [Dillenia turbinata]|uniref:Protein kinase domain-containing protein n=1 Tax=Dillenia turbinata TaxID=194707 RepID=A0AAN8ZQT4_9MAGN